VNDQHKPTTVVDDVVVSINYTLTVDGQIIDASEESDPLEYLQGYQNIIPGLEREMAGMKIGESKEVTVQPKDGYGELDPNAVIEVPRSEFPKDFEVKPGVELQLQNRDGEMMNAVIADVTPQIVKLDLNHPLAGKELQFRVTVVDLRDATDEEKAHGHIHGEDLDEEDFDDEELYGEDDGDGFEDEDNQN
jgi:FKBP-type peptidyl-prolyl cis-trans isomerase SlyD